MKSLLVVFLFLTLISCKDDRVSLLNKFPTDEKVSKSELFSDDILNIFDNDLSWFSDFVLKDSLIVVNKMLPNPYYYTVYNVNTGDSILSFGRQGQAPGEFPDYSYSSLSGQDNNTLNVLIPNAGALYQVYLDSLSLEGYKPRVEARPGYALGGLVDKESVYFVTEKEGRLAMVNNTGDVLSTGLTYPFENSTDGIPSHIWDMAYQSVLKRQPNGNRAILANYYAPNFDIFKLDSAFTVIKSSHLATPEVFDKSGDIEGGGKMVSISVSDTNEMGYQDVEVTEDYIYLLYSGRTYAEYGEAAASSDLVYVLNWEGEFVSEIILDEQTRAIAISDDNSSLYALLEDEIDGRNSLKRYELTDVFND